MYLNLLTKVLTQINMAASGPDILDALIIVIYASNFEIMDKVRYKMTATKLSSFPGENVELYCNNQLSLLQKLDNAGFFQTQHLSSLASTMNR